MVIPQVLRQQILTELHSGHLGIVRMKHLARSFVWWPKIDADLETLALQCNDCAQTRHMPSKNMIHPWKRPAGPWQRIHVDFLGPVNGHMFMIVVCAYSKWPEVIVKNEGVTASQTIEALRSLFAIWSLPLHLHSDNGVQFTSKQFELFMKANGIHHTTSAVYHPSSNGQAERFVATFKRALKTMDADTNSSLQTKIARFLITYRNATNSSTGELPSVLMTGRRLRTRLDLIRPTAKNISPQPKHSHRELLFGQPVLVRDYRANKPKWISGQIQAKIGQQMYSVRVTINDSTTTWKRHIDQIIPRSTAAQPEVREPGEPHLDIEPSHIEPSHATLSNSYAPVIMRQQHPATHGTSSSSNSPPVATTPPEVPQQQPQTSQPASQNTSAAEPAPPEIKTSSSGCRILPPRKLQDFVPK